MVPVSSTGDDVGPERPTAGIEVTAYNFTAIVSGVSYEISVYYSESKKVWIACGNYKDRRIEVTESSLGGVVKSWREAAASVRKRGTFPRRQ